MRLTMSGGSFQKKTPSRSHVFNFHPTRSGVFRLSGYFVRGAVLQDNADQHGKQKEQKGKVFLIVLIPSLKYLNV